MRDCNLQNKTTDSQKKDEFVLDICNSDAKKKTSSTKGALEFIFIQAKFMLGKKEERRNEPQNSARKARPHEW